MGPAAAARAGGGGAGRGPPARGSRAAGQAARRPHGRPTASELLDAVREFLTDQVMPATSGQLAFHARVAANVLAIVARELELGPVPAETGSAGTAGLADAVAARLAVANPKYFDPVPPAP